MNFDFAFCVLAARSNARVVAHRGEWSTGRSEAGLCFIKKSQPLERDRVMENIGC
jgi:hypothetical protein